MNTEISIAMETSCRAGGLALAVGDELLGAARFDAAARQTTQLICRMRDLLAGASVEPERLDHIYVSSGPGSFTGLRIGMTVARTMAQMLPRLKCVAVPTVRAIAQNAAPLDWQHLAVVLAVKRSTVYAALFERDGGGIIPAGPGAVVPIEAFLAEMPRPIMLIGEGLDYLQPPRDGVYCADRALWLPTAEGVWAVGRTLAAKGEFRRYNELLPNYARDPEAVRLWQARRATND